MKSNFVKCILAIFLGIIIFIALCFFDITYIISLILDFGKLNVEEIRLNEQIKKEKILEINDVEDIYGFWKDDEYGFDNRYEALIDKDSITIYGYLENEKHIYWIGSFKFENDIVFGNKEKVISNNYEAISKYITTASHSKVKDFTYDNGTITFLSYFNDDFLEVHLKRYIPYNDRLRMIKYSNERVSQYDESKNRNIKLDNLTISYPNYFDVEEENSYRNITDYYAYNIDDSLVLKNGIVLSPSNTKSHAEFFVSNYRNNKIKDFYELYDEILNNSENYNLETNELLQIVFNSEKNSIMIIFITKYVSPYNDNKVIYGLGFENWMLSSDKQELINMGLSYSYDDTSDYDYISDFEKVIGNIGE